MAQVICPSCDAELEIEAPAGTEFECGACGATIAMPEIEAAPAAPVQRSGGMKPGPRPPAGGGRTGVQKPAGPGRPGGAAAKPAGGRPGASGGRRPSGPAAGGDGKSNQKPLFIALGVGGVIIVALLIKMLGGSDPEPVKPPVDPPKAAPAPVKEPETKPVVKVEPKPVVKRRAPRPNDMLDMIGALRWDMETPDAKAPAYAVFSAHARQLADEFEAEGDLKASEPLRKQAHDAAEAGLKLDPENAKLRDLLGFARFDEAATKRLLSQSWMRPFFKAELEIALPEAKRELSKDGAPTWVDCKDGPSKELAIRWRELMRRAERWEKTALDPENDRFSKAALKNFNELEKDVGEKLKRTDISGSSFEVFTFRPYVLYVLKDKDGGEDRIAEKWIEQLEQVRDTFFARYRRRLGLNLADFGEKGVPVLVLRTFADYKKYNDNKESSTIAHFEPWSGRLVTWAGAAAQEGVAEDVKDKNVGLTVAEIRGVVFHESTHQLVHFVTRESGRHLAAGQAMWFSEGIAEYFGGHARRWDSEAGRWRYIPGKINTMRIGTLTNLRKNLMPFDKLLDYLRQDYSSDSGPNSKGNFKAEIRVTLAYAQGWALCYFLNEWDGGKYRDKFDAYVKEERVGRSGIPTWRKIFGNDWTAIEKEYFDAIDEIIAAAKEKRIVNGDIVPRGK